jgi:hypothetical protein
MKTKTLARRVVNVRKVGDQQALERRRKEEEAAEAADVQGAERRRWEQYVAIHCPDGRSPLWKALNAFAVANGGEEIPPFPWIPDEDRKPGELAAALDAFKRKHGMADNELEDVDVAGRA